MAAYNRDSPSSRPSSSSSSSELEPPLFDPSGLSSSASGDNSQGSNIEPGSFAAIRLGLSPPLQQQNGSTSSVCQASAAASGTSSSPERRGRRRRSSHFARDSPSPVDTAATDATTLDATRQQEGWPGPSRHHRPSVGLDIAAASTSALGGQGGSRRAFSDSLSPDPMCATRSPAADFLSSFSARNSMIDTTSSPATTSPRWGSPSSRPASMLLHDGHSRLPSATGAATAPLDMSGSWQGLGGAASQLLGTDASASTSSLAHTQSGLRPDDEGYRFGPNGRYSLGRVAGFGGSSTVREGWDTSNGSERHKVAVKLTYHALGEQEVNDELKIWRSLPAHRHLLPLLHDERVAIPNDSKSSGPSNASSFAKRQQELQLLVMPFCDGGNLMDFIRSEGGRRNDSPPRGAAMSISRSHSLRQAGATRAPASPARTASGFVSPASHANRSFSASESMPSAAPSAGIQRTSSIISNGSSSGILRRTSIKKPRSQGVSMAAARQAARQIADGLYCLHHRSHVLHADLKLENVLAQRSRNDDGSDPADSQDVWWRLADFGLSRRIDVEASNGWRNSMHNLSIWRNSSPEKRASSISSSTSRSQSHGTSRAGSTAYTAPEVWRSGDSYEEQDVSPFAADMWALGCIVYALLSGKLPFTDAFEPRLQAKIAKGEWDVPTRLWRRARRLTTGQIRANGSLDSPFASRHQRSATDRSSGDYSSMSSSVNTLSDRPQQYDLSASLPPISPPRAHRFQAAPHAAAAAHDAPVVGSAPIKPGVSHRYDVDLVAQAVADAEADAESDEDTAIDQTWDGNSSDRAGAREVLAGLLEVDPARRWTIERLLASPWLSSSESRDRVNPFDSITAHPRGPKKLEGVTEGVAWGVDASHAQKAYPDRPAWNREKSWRTELTFDRVEPKKPQQVKRESSLSRSRPPSSARDHDSSRSRSVSQHRQGRESSHGSGDSVIVHSRQRSPSTRRPSSPMEIRGRQPRSQHDASLERPHDQYGEEGLSSLSEMRSRPVSIVRRSRSQSGSSHLDDPNAPDAMAQSTILTRSRSRPTMRSGVAALSSNGSSTPNHTPAASDRGRATVGAPSKTASHRSSTSRSRSRAPDALARLLDLDRTRSKGGAAGSGSNRRLGQEEGNGIEGDQNELRGRARGTKDVNR